MGVTNLFKGAGVVEGVNLSADGQIVATAVPGPAFSFDVSCDGTISNGKGQDEISGEIVMVTEAPGAKATTKYQFSGSESYEFAGSVKTNANGTPLLEITVKVISGYIMNQVSGIAVTAFGTFPIPPTPPVREEMTGKTMVLKLPVLSYSDIDGTLEVDMKQSPTFQGLQIMADSFLQVAGIPVDITYLGAAIFETTAIEIKSITPEKTLYFLKDIVAMNDIEVAMWWRKSTGTRTVKFSYDGVETTETSGRDSISQKFDMGKSAEQLTIEATADGVSDGPKTIELKKVTVSPWAKAFLTQAASGRNFFRYEGDAAWPPLPAIHTQFGSAPIIGGLWSLLSQGKNECIIYAYSSGAPEDTGVLDWQYHFSVPFTRIKLDFKLKGKTSTTINENGLKMSGSADLEPHVWQGNKHVGIGEVFPGVVGAVSALSSHLAAAIATAGLDATLKFSIGGNGTFSADETEPKIEWDTGTGKLRLTGQLMLTVAPPPIGSVVQGRFWGAANACLDLKFYPEIAVEKFGAELNAGYEINIIRVTVLTGSKRWPLAGGGCPDLSTGQPLNPAAHGLATPGGTFPTDGQPRIALHPDGRSAAVWIESPDSSAGSHGDVFLRITDSTGSSRTVRITLDTVADQAPHAAFDKQGRIVVVWQRNAMFPGTPTLEQLDAFAAGFEIAQALVDAANGTVISTSLLTTNAAFDFGATLYPNADGEILLTWGQSKRVFGGGDAQDPASIHAAIWDGTAWSAGVNVVTNLRGNFGWRAAFGTNQTAAVAYVLDGDLDYETATDRELYLIQGASGVWGSPRQITTNTVADSFPALIYMPSNRLALAWMQDRQVVGTVGAGSLTPAVWIKTNDLVSLNFAHAELIASGTRLFAVWPAANDLYTVELPLDPAAVLSPSEPTALLSDPRDTETAFAAVFDGTERLRYAAASHPITTTTNGLPIFAAKSKFIAGSKELPPVTAGPIIRELRILAPNKLRLAWTSINGRNYIIESSDDLRAWTSAKGAAATASETSVELEMPLGLKARYFRIKLEQ